MKSKFAKRVESKCLGFALLCAGSLFALGGCSSGSQMMTQDTTPPTAPANLMATATLATSINLSWTASTDNVGVTQYKVERCQGAACANFAQIATPAANTFNDTGLTASTAYSYRVRAADAAGNNSAYSNVFSTSTPAAGSNVSVTITPRRGGITTGQTLPFTATVTNDVGGAGVTWSKSGGSFSSQSTSAATFSSTTTGSFTITATSMADNMQSASATIGVTDLSGVTTYHNDLARDGTNVKEFALTTSNVNANTFGKLFSCPVDGEMYAQPLWVANVSIGGGTHNVIFAATQNDSVYAFDADAKPCAQYWKTSFLGAGITPVQPSDTGEAFDINTTIGITGTPVIDATGGTLYVVAKTKEASGYHQRLHALSLTSGGDKVTAFDITPAITVPGVSDTGDSSVGCTSTPGHVPFCPLRQNQRPGLTFANNLVYVAWASHGDVPPYHGWIMSFDPSTLALQSVYNVSPDATTNGGRESGIWMAGGAPAVDASGNLYVLTGNGTFDANSGTAPNDDYGDSFLKLSSSLSVLDWFTPKDEANLEAQDLDLGSGGAVVLVDLPLSAFPHILIGGGKGSGFAGEVYVLSRDNMRHFNSGSDNVVQEFTLGSGIFSTGAFWQNTYYIGGVGLPLKAFSLNTSSSQLSAAATSQSSHSFGFPGATPAVSSAGTTGGTGIVWALDTNSTTAANASGTAGPAVLYAYDATNLATQLYRSDTTSGAANAAANAVKFCVPTVANGKVYVGGQGAITVFGLLP